MHGDISDWLSAVDAEMGPLHGNPPSESGYEERTWEVVLDMKNSL